MDAVWDPVGDADLPSSELGWGSFYADNSNAADQAPSISAVASDSSAKIWHEGNVDIVHYQPAPAHPSCADRDLMRKFPRPDVVFQTFYPASETSKLLSYDNYQTKFKDLLFAEENAQQQYIQWYNKGCTAPQRSLQFNAPHHEAISGSAEIFFSSTLSTQAGIMRSVERVAGEGELFGTLRVCMPIKPDTPWGRLMGRDVTYALLASPDQPVSTVYEVRVVYREELSITLLCPTTFVSHFNLANGETRIFYIQFLLDRVSYVQQLESIDRQIPSNIARLFVTPETIENFLLLLQNSYKAEIDALPMPSMKQQLNSLQRTAIRTVLALDLLEEKLNKCLYTPPLLVVGPFGTGKTHTLAECVRQLLYAENLRQNRRSTESFIDRDKMLNHERPTHILICTNSNSAADLYMLNFLPDIDQIKAFRVFALTRFMTRNIMQYVEHTNRNLNPIGEAGFVIPTFNDLRDKRVVITTLNAASLLCHPTSDLPEGFFSHIIIDEAAQITEPTCIVPLRLATGATKILLAGDPLQSNPRVYSEFCIENGLNKSLLERLFNLYKSMQASSEAPLSAASRENSFEDKNSLFSNESHAQNSSDKSGDARRNSFGRKRSHNKKSSKDLALQQQQCPLIVVLSSNYRSHRDICRLMSELFYTKYYGRPVIAANEQVLQHPVCPTLLFIPNSEDSTDMLTNGSYYNAHEVELVCNMVDKIVEDWPEGDDAWGPVQHEQIAVVTPYMEQVKAVRNLLRERGRGDVTVENVNNVQGRQFRAIIMSCVRTRTTMKYTPYELVNEENTDLGYLSDLKMVNTVITRAQSLVCVVGSAVDLLAYGRCSKMWHKFLEFCTDPEYYSEDRFSRDKSAAAVVREKLNRKIEWNLRAPEFLPFSLLEAAEQLTNGDATAHMSDESLKQEPMSSIDKDDGTAAAAWEGAGKPLMPGEELLLPNTPAMPAMSPIGAARPPRASSRAKAPAPTVSSAAYLPQIYRDKQFYSTSTQYPPIDRNSFSHLHFSDASDAMRTLYGRMMRANQASSDKLQPTGSTSHMSGALPRPLSSSGPRGSIYASVSTQPAALYNRIADIYVPGAQQSYAQSFIQTPPNLVPLPQQFPSNDAMANFYYNYIVAYVKTLNEQQQHYLQQQQQHLQQQYLQQVAAAQQSQHANMIHNHMYQAAAVPYDHRSGNYFRHPPPVALNTYVNGSVPPGNTTGPLLHCVGNPYLLPRNFNMAAAGTAGRMQLPPLPSSSSSSSIPNGRSTSAISKEIHKQQLQAALLAAAGSSQVVNDPNNVIAQATPAVPEERADVAFQSLGKVSFVGEAAAKVKRNFDVGVGILQNNHQSSNNNSNKTLECMCSYCGRPLRVQNIMSHMEITHKSEYEGLKKAMDCRSLPMMFFGYVDHASSSSKTVRPVPKKSSQAMNVVAPTAGDVEAAVLLQLQSSQSSSIQNGASFSSDGASPSNASRSSKSIVGNAGSNVVAATIRRKASMPAPMPILPHQPQPSSANSSAAEQPHSAPRTVPTSRSPSKSSNTSLNRRPPNNTKKK